VYKEADKVQSSNRMACDPNNHPKDGKVCQVDITSQFGVCTKENQYGYARASPCVFLKLNKVRLYNILFK